MQKRIGGIILTVLGVAGAFWVYARMTSFMGQTHTWAPPFDNFEIATLIVGVVALILIILGIIFITFKPKQ